jgi:carboxyl-terminal processing protease
MRRRLLVSLALACGVGRASAQPAPLTSQAAYDTVQRLRDQARPLWSARDPRGVDLLRRALGFLDRPEVRDLGQGWPYLRSRASNVWWEIALAETLRGDTAAALSAFEMLVRHGGGSGYARWMREDSVARRWTGHPRFERVAAQLRQQRRMWGDSAFVSPFRDSLPEHERLAGLALVWSEVRYGYPDFAQRPALDWDSLYVATIPRVQRARSTYDYYRELQRFVAELGDSHTNVFFPRAFATRLALPPLRTRRVEGRTLVTELRSPSLRALGLRVGDEVESIDGLPVDEYARTRVAPYQAAATPQDLEVRTYTYQLLGGPVDSAVTLGVRHADGARATVRVARGGYTDVVAPPPPVFDSILPGNVGYLRINTFGHDSVSVWTRRAMQRLARTSGLVIDVRNNGGGNTDYSVLAMLARGRTETSAQRVRNYSALDRARGIEPQVYEVGTSAFAPDTTLRYEAPVVLLIGPQTFSAAEDFAVGFDMLKRGTIVGEPSGGNTGQPLGFVLPGGGSARVRTKHDYYADGREFLFVGVQPQVLVRPTVAGVRAGRDEVLEEGLRRLRR